MISLNFSFKSSSGSEFQTPHNYDQRLTFEDSRSIVRPLSITREEVANHDATAKFPLKNVTFIEEENHCRLSKELRGADGLPKQE